jgi:RNA polymerase sigma-70 factor (ECF subfamily)
MVNHSGLDFENVYDDYQPKIFRYLSRLTDEREAEDLTQEVFIKASRALETFRGESQISTWLYRIATNTALDKMRTRSFRQNTQEIGLDDICDTQVRDIWIREESTSLEQSLLKKERFHCFTSFVQKLPVNYRMVILLSEIEEMTCKEIAEILGLSQDVVKIRLHRGRAKLLQELKAHCKPDEWL